MEADASCGVMEQLANAKVQLERLEVVVPIAAVDTSAEGGVEQVKLPVDPLDRIVELGPEQLVVEPSWHAAHAVVEHVVVAEPAYVVAASTGLVERSVEPVGHSVDNSSFDQR